MKILLVGAVMLATGLGISISGFNDYIASELIIDTKIEKEISILKMKVDLLNLEREEN